MKHEGKPWLAEGFETITVDRKCFVYSYDASKVFTAHFVLSTQFCCLKLGIVGRILLVDDITY